MRLRLGLLLLAALAAPAQQLATRPATAMDVAAGAKIFRSHCAPCHGQNGKGGLGPNLTTGVFYHGSSDADIYRNITEGIPGTAMPSTFFDGTQAWQIVAFVRSLNQSAALPASAGGDASHGAVLFREKGCSGCHLVRGDGGVRGPDLSAIGSQRSATYLRQAILQPGERVAEQYWVAKVVLHDGRTFSGFLMNEDTHTLQILDFSSGLRSLAKSDLAKFEIDRRSIMPSYKDKLTEAELGELVNYLSSLRRESRSE